MFRETVAVYCENHTDHTDTVRTSQETHYVSTTEPNRLMLFGETVAVYCKNHTEHTHVLSVQNTQLCNTQSDDSYSYLCKHNWLPVRPVQRTRLNVGRGHGLSASALRPVRFLSPPNHAVTLGSKQPQCDANDSRTLVLSHEIVT
jgi:hypothetical protein